MNEIKIENKVIGKDSQVFLIAEAGVNHNGKKDLAIRLVDIAFESNVDAIKFQTFNAEELLLKSTPKVEYQRKNKNDDEDFYSLIKRLTLKEEDFKELKDYCDKKGIIFLSTPFGEESVDLLDKINIPAYKVGSGDMNNYPLLKKICSKGKPILLSTGMANLDEVKESVSLIKEKGLKDLIILQCTTNYPANIEELNLNVIKTYIKEFPDDIIGFSDHSLGFEASIVATAMGVKVIEKHFTLDKNMEGPDHKASLDPGELNDWVKTIRKTEKSLGSYEKFASKNELEIALIARKSIVTLKNILKGTIIKRDDIGIKRPGNGIRPKYFEELIGKKVKKDIPPDTILLWDDLI